MYDLIVLIPYTHASVCVHVCIYGQLLHWPLLDAGTILVHSIHRVLGNLHRCFVASLRRTWWSFGGAFNDTIFRV